jgi:integrase/recombinase XerC
MNLTPLPALQSGTPTAWEEAVYAFLIEKRSRSGSTRTVESYSRMLWPLFRRLGKTPDQVTAPDVLAWAHGIGLSGRTPSATTVGARIACLSSFYRFTIRMGLLASNPCDALQRPRIVPSVARGYSAAEVGRLLAIVPDTVRGRRDRAILLVLILTGRRRAEVIGLRAGDLSLEDDVAYCRYVGKGHKTGRRELPRPAYEAIRATLADTGTDLATMVPESSLWQAGASPQGISSGTFYGRFRRYLAAARLTPTGLNVLRHSAAKLRRDAGESIEAVSAFLDHSSLAVTTVYLRRLEGETDRTWPDVAAAIGV